MISAKTSERLRTVAFLCALLVVTIHCQSMIPWFAGEMPVGKLEAALYFLGTYTVSRIAVPIFFTITGFFLVKGYPGNGWFIREIRKRVFTLYVPFVTWNALYLAIALLAGEPLKGFGAITAKILGYDPYVRLGCMQFWYLQAVFIYVLAAPLILPLLRNKWQGVALICFFLVGWVSTFWYYLPLPLAAGNFMWLAVGSWVGFRMRDADGFSELRNTLVDRRFLVIALFCISVVCKVFFGVYCNKMAFDIADKVLVLSGVCAVFANLQLVDRVSPLCRRFVGLTFFIYATHTLMISVALRVGVSFHLPTLITYLLKISSGVVLSVVSGVLFRHYQPKAFNFLTGGRS